MRILVVGGLDRLKPFLDARTCGTELEVEVHRGDMSGRGSISLRTAIERADLVIVQTDVNSHDGVRQARKFAKMYGTPIELVRRFGVHQCEVILERLTQRGVISAPPRAPGLATADRTARAPSRFRRRSAPMRSA